MKEIEILKGYLTDISDSITVDLDLYETTLEELKEYILAKGTNMGQFSAHLICCLDYFLFFNDLSTETEKKGIDSWKKASALSKALIAEDVGAEPSRQFYTSGAGLYLTLDLCYRLSLSDPVMNQREYQSMLVHLYWQYIIYEGVFYKFFQEAARNQIQEKSILWFFQNHNRILSPEEIYITENFNGTIEIPKNTLIVQSIRFNIDRLTDKASLNDYSSYSISPVIGPVIQSMDNGIKGVIRDCDSLDSNERIYFMRAVIYLIYRLKCDYLLLENDALEDSLKNALSEYIDFIKNIDRLGGSVSMSQQKRLRKYLFNSLKNHKEEFENQEIRNYLKELEEQWLPKELSKKITTEGFSMIRNNINDLNRFMDILNDTGGMNLLQFSSIKVISENGIEYHPGYIGGEQPRKGPGVDK